MHPLTDTEVYQETHYYPFGMTMEGEWQNIVNGPENNYLYNGKELADDFGLDWSYYGFRMYDSQIGRFPSVDPIADNFAHVSPFNYAENNVPMSIDLWGLQSANSAANSFHTGEGAKFQKSHPKTAAAIAIGFIAVPLAGAVGVEATTAFVLNEVKDEGLSYLTNGWSDVIDITKQGKNILEKGAKKIIEKNAKDDGGLVLQRMGSKQATKDDGWREGDYFLTFPDQGSAKANWKKNDSLLREEMAKGEPIKDSFTNPNGSLIPAREVNPTTGKTSGAWFNAERNRLESSGWTYSPMTESWFPPKK
jgi:RHS repeat-associated protein